MKRHVVGMTSFVSRTGTACDTGTSGVYRTNTPSTSSVRKRRASLFTLSTSHATSHKSCATCVVPHRREACFFTHLVGSGGGVDDDAGDPEEEEHHRGDEEQPSTHGEVELGLHREDGDGEADCRRDADRDQDDVSVVVTAVKPPFSSGRLQGPTGSSLSRGWGRPCSLSSPRTPLVFEALEH